MKKNPEIIISLKDINKSFPLEIGGEQQVLFDINFTVRAGEFVAIMGPSGSGKSTVVNMIPRLYDVLDGKVSIAGVDVRDFDLPHLRQCIGVVTQETYLFNGTSRENLLYAKPDATEEEMIEACKKALLIDSKNTFAYNSLAGIYFIISANSFATVSSLILTP